MATRTHYSKPYLSMVETGKRAATTNVVKAYERVLGVSKLGEDVNRRDFFKVVSLVAGNIKVATELAASIAGNDSGPLGTVQTTHGTDLAIATLADRGTVAHLRRWLDNGDNPILCRSVDSTNSRAQFIADRAATSLRSSTKRGRGVAHETTDDGP
jgi:hypothetical protein